MGGFEPGWCNHDDQDFLQWPQEITTLFCSDLKTQTTSLSNEFKCFNAQDHVTLAQSLSDHKSQQPPQGVLCIRSKEISIPESGFYLDEILKYNM